MTAAEVRSIMESSIRRGAVKEEAELERLREEVFPRFRDSVFRVMERAALEGRGEVVIFPSNCQVESCEFLALREDILNHLRELRFKTWVQPCGAIEVSWKD